LDNYRCVSKTHVGRSQASGHLKTSGPVDARGVALMVFTVSVYVNGMYHRRKLWENVAIGKRVVCMWERVRDVQMV